MSTFGARLKDLRKYLRLSQEEFGLKIGLSKSGVSKCELNKSFMSEETLRSLVTSFHINLNYLVAGEGDPFISTTGDDELTLKVEEILKNRGIIK